MTSFHIFGRERAESQPLACVHRKHVFDCALYIHVKFVPSSCRVQLYGTAHHAQKACNAFLRRIDAPRSSVKYAHTVCCPPCEVRVFLPSYVMLITNNDIHMLTRYLVHTYLRTVDSVSISYLHACSVRHTDCVSGPTLLRTEKKPL